MTFDEKLTQALGDTIEKRIEHRCTVTQKHRFSLSYKLWKRRMINNLKHNCYKKQPTIRKTRYALLAVIIAVSLFLGATACAASNVIGRYFFDPKPDHSRFHISNIQTDKKKIEEYYGLSEENGWKIIDYFANDELTLIGYECDGVEITFSQDIIKEDMGTINTENVVVESISIYEENDGFYINYDDGLIMLQWIYDGYLFGILGNIDKYDAINLAHSTKIINFEKNL